MKNSNSIIQFTQLQIENLFQSLISVDLELKHYFENYLYKAYKDNLSERLYYLDIAEIANFINDKIKTEQTDFFQKFFNSVEEILKACDNYIDDLIVVGLFESIQNFCNGDADCYSSFDKWLQPLSKQKWDNLNKSWEKLNR